MVFVYLCLGVFKVVYGMYSPEISEEKRVDDGKRMSCQLECGRIIPSDETGLVKQYELFDRECRNNLEFPDAYSSSEYIVE